MLALTGCSLEPEPRAVDARSATTLSRVRLDPTAATAKLNAYRAENGLNPLRLDPTLTAMAERQAQAMAKSGTMSHDVDGSLSARLAASGIKAPTGENLAAGYMSLDEVLGGWRASAGQTPICSCPARPGLASRSQRTRTTPPELIGLWRWAPQSAQAAHPKWCGSSRFLSCLGSTTTRRIDQAAAEADFAIVDLEGRAAGLAGYATASGRLWPQGMNAWSPACSTDRPSDEMRRRPTRDCGQSGGHDSFERQWGGRLVIIESMSGDFRVEVFRHNIDALERTGGPHGVQPFLEPVGARNRLHHNLPLFACQRLGILFEPADGLGRR
jgi:Cysteine-rich secretory protein family